MLLPNGQATAFWGHGYAALAFPQQKFLDELHANFIKILRNLSVGRVISKKGLLDLKDTLTGYGINIEVESDMLAGADLRSVVMPFPSEAPPQFLFELFQYTLNSIDEMMPSLSPVFTGDSPHEGASGRAINNLQWASFNQISANVREMNEHRLAIMRILITHIQQFAKKPVSPHLRRRGVDFPNQFPETARHIGYNLKMEDAASLPTTPSGKLELATVLASLGAVLPIDKLIKFVGFDKGYGWDASTFQHQTTPMGAPQANITALTGVDAGNF